MYTISQAVIINLNSDLCNLYLCPTVAHLKSIKPTPIMLAACYPCKVQADVLTFEPFKTFCLHL